MARKKKGSHRSKGLKKYPIAVAAPVAYLGWWAVDRAMHNDISNLRHGLTGYGDDGKLHVEYLTGTYGPVVVGALIHMGASKLGINRRIPFVSI